MSDQGFYQKSINTGAAAEQAFTETGIISASTTLAKADTNSGAYKLQLPSAAANPGITVTVVNVGGGNLLSVGPESGENLDGAPGSVAIGAAAYDSGVFTSMGADGWLQVV